MSCQVVVLAVAVAVWFSIHQHVSVTIGTYDRNRVSFRVLLVRVSTDITQLLRCSLMVNCDR